MRFLCLAYGDEEGWNSLSEEEKHEALARDERIRDAGNTMAAVRTDVVSVTNWEEGGRRVTREPYASHALPLAGFAIIEAGDVDEVVELVANTPCARARGVIEIRPFWTDPETA